MICIPVAGALSYSRGRLKGRAEQQEAADNRRRREAARKETLLTERQTQESKAEIRKIFNPEQERPMDDQQIQALQAQIRELKNKSASASRKMEALEDSLRQRGREISLLSEASLFLTTGDFQKTCDLIADRVGILPYVKFARLYMLNEEATTLRLVAGYNISEKYLEMIKDKFELSVNNIPSGVAVINKAPFVVNDVSKDEHFTRWTEITTLYDYRSYIAVPLLRIRRILGVLEIFFEKDNLLTKNYLDIINTISNMGALAIENCLFISKLEELSTIDELTSAFNHRFLINTFEKEIERAVRYRHPLSYVMFDLDNFKLINDTMGHLKGNEVLRSVAAALKQTVRSTDYVCRYGGDEFAVLLPETKKEDALKMVEKIRATTLPLWQGLPQGTGMSIGVGAFPEDGGTVAELIKHADDLVYEEKKKKKAR